AAEGLANWCQGLIEDLEGASYNRESALQMLRTLCTLNSLASADYETARQIISVFQVIYEDLAPTDGKDRQLKERLANLTEELDLRPYWQRSERQQVINKVLEELVGAKKIKGMGEFYDALQNLGNLELQKKQQKNPFLITLRNDIGDEELTKTFQEKS